MATELKLPDMGEGIDDVTISAWRVSEGDTVNEGDIILEVATDKVDTEVPASASGTILKLNVGEGEIAPIDAVLAIIGQAGEAVESPAEEAAAEQSVALETVETAPASAPNDVKASPVAIRVASDQNVSLDNLMGTGPGGRIIKADVLAAAENGTSGDTRVLPEELANVVELSVARVASDWNIELDEVAKGRQYNALTRYDVLDAVAKRDGTELVSVRHQPPAGWRQRDASPASAADEAAKSTSASAAPQTKPAPSASPTPKLAASEELIKHSRMRAAVARSTSESAFTAPHVTTMWDLNMAAVLAHRKAHKAEYGAAGVNLTVTAYLIAAIVEGLKAVPAANATWTDEGVIIKRHYNVGMAVALPVDEYGMGGLIVPVIKNAGDLNLMGMARAVNDYAAAARAGQLTAEDLAGGTFTLSNYGTSGSRFQTPIIVQPQVGILGVGAIEKRPVVISDGHPLEANTGDHLAFLPMTTLGFSYDHRVLDGATADAFCAKVKQTLEGWA